MTDTFPGAGFGSIHFGGVDLGDARVNQRLASLTDLLVTSGAESRPDQFAAPADYRVLNRIAGRPEATHDAVTAPHRAHTRARMAAHPGPVLVLHDTTELDYSGRVLPRTGPIGNGHGTGWECHNSLAVGAGTGAVLGLVAQPLHRRPPTRSNRGETTAQRRQRRDRESRLWVLGLDAVDPAPDGRHWVHVSPRGSNTFEYLSALVAGSHRFVVRSRHDRVLSVGANLHAHLRARPATAAWSGVVRCGPHGGLDQHRGPVGGRGAGRAVGPVWVGPGGGVGVAGVGTEPADRGRPGGVVLAHRLGPGHGRGGAGGGQLVLPTADH
ncbi:hypothetical protein R5W23_005218 [Gemmata sp. JC673]|uniref:Uncharacterized protein n=1 Tax=Gemmata algarum TaxID=2975278 RepID=A0ABU5F7Z3_9BACT|nr:hypothetical protein [Gemmata algarum]MDY3563604.1 hypothetical protein [Gemmata algarum]